MHGCYVGVTFSFRKEVRCDKAYHLRVVYVCKTFANVSFPILRANVCFTVRIMFKIADTLQYMHDLKINLPNKSYSRDNRLNILDSSH